MAGRYLRVLVAALLVGLFVSAVAYGESLRVVARFDFADGDTAYELREGELAEVDGASVARRLGADTHMRVMIGPREPIPVVAGMVMRVRYQNVGSPSSTMVNQFIVDTADPTTGAKKQAMDHPKPLELGQWQVREFIITEMPESANSQSPGKIKVGENITRLTFNSRGTNTGEEHGIYVDYVEILVPAE